MCVMPGRSPSVSKVQRRDTRTHTQAHTDTQTHAWAVALGEQGPAAGHTHTHTGTQTHAWAVALGELAGGASETLGGPVAVDERHPRPPQSHLRVCHHANIRVCHHLVSVTRTGGGEEDAADTCGPMLAIH